MINRPKRMKKCAWLPGLDVIVNTVVDFTWQERIIVGPGLQELPSLNGKLLRVSDEILSLAAAAANKSNGSPGSTGGNNSGGPVWITDPTNPDGGYWDSTTDQTNSGGGAGLPGTSVDANGNPTYGGNLLGWQLLNICVSDGLGGWTPMKIDSYATAPHA